METDGWSHYSDRPDRFHGEYDDELGGPERLVLRWNGAYLNYWRLEVLRLATNRRARLCVHCWGMIANQFLRSCRPPGLRGDSRSNVRGTLCGKRFVSLWIVMVQLAQVCRFQTPLSPKCWGPVAGA